MNMNDAPLPLFVVEEDGAPPPPVPPVLMMTEAQRAEIRGLFGRLGVRDAVTQFGVTEELTGTRISAPAQLDAATAQRLIAGLQKRIVNSGRDRAGSSWDNREEDTWIDRL